MTVIANEWLTTATGNWVLDPSATTISLRTKAMWVLGVKASFKAIEGSGVVAADGTVTGILVIDAASVNTGNAKRDKHLLTKDFLEVDTNPTFTYKATAAVPALDGTFAVTGSLTIHGNTRPLALTATITPSDPDSATVSAEAAIDRSQWGIDWAKMGANLHNEVVVIAVFKKASPLSD